MKRPINKSYILAAIVLIIAAAVVYKVVADHSAQEQTTSANSSQALTGKSSPTKTSPQPAKNASPEPSSKNLVSPAEQSTYASYHTPGINTPEESVCVTSPGAICYIQFTRGSEVKRLTKKVVDSSGTATWDWTPGSAGLSKGAWEVSAIASLDGQSKTGSDALDLEVQ